MTLHEAAAETGHREQPGYEPEHETRLAVVMYGGVSLAIYMYGVAEELLRLVRSTARAPGTEQLRVPQGTERVYRELARLLDEGTGAGAAGAREDGGVATRFVVDIVSGTSAGGINGICLAKALANDGDLEPLKKVWSDEGAIGMLLNDPESVERASGPNGKREPIAGLAPYKRPPTSLLSGRRMQYLLERSLAGIRRKDGSEPSTLVDELDLWVTSTDLDGLPVEMRFANTVARERRHANRYHFRHVPGGATDFGPDDNAFLAYAARATSAFPFAFDPATLEALKPFLDPSPSWEERTEAWRRLHPDYADPDLGYAGRSFSDGGILDNKPFTQATQTLIGRRAALPVERKLVYIEPDPGAANGSPGPSRPQWNAIDTAQAATLRIPRIETIREDVEALVNRNRDIERVRDVASYAGVFASESRRLRALAQTEAEGALGPRLGPEAGGATYGLYERLRHRGTVDWIAAAIAEHRSIDPRSDAGAAIRQLVRAWRLETLPEGVTEAADVSFLARYDVPYRLRRLAFVLQVLGELTDDDQDLIERHRKLAQATGAVKPPDRGFRLRLYAARAAYASVLAEVSGASFSALELTTADLVAILAERDDAAQLEAAQRLMASRSLAFGAIAGEVNVSISSADVEAEAIINRLLASAGPNGPALETILRFFYDTFEAYDLVLHPLSFGTSIGETNPVEVLRISPQDAKGPTTTARPPLKGMRLHHFGAFLDKNWRLHDMAWGRLDAAECLIDALLPGHPERERLVREAHASIVHDYALEDVQTTDTEALAKLSTPGTSERPEDEEDTRRALARGRKVMADVLAEVVRSKTRATETGGEHGAATKFAGPVLDATVAQGSRMAAFRAVMMHSKAGLAVGALAAGGLASSSLALAAEGPARVAGAALAGATGGVALAACGGLYLGLAKARSAIDHAVWKAVMGPDTDAAGEQQRR